MKLNSLSQKTVTAPQQQLRLLGMVTTQCSQIWRQSEMICKVKESIENHRMLHNVKSVAVGVSGGADSMCLIDVLLKIKDEYGLTLKAVHVNHNIRGEEAQRDENHVRDYCEKNNVDLLVFDIDVPKLSKKQGISEEECGRNVRYECFRKADCDVVATAHTLSDSVETVIFNLLRGTGSKGLCGIPAKRQPDIIRPLIDCTREEIEEYCRRNEINFVTDSTNLTDDYNRNYIRHNIVPSFGKINEAAVKSIAKAAEILGEENDFIEECAVKLINSSRINDSFSLNEFVSSHSAVRKRALRILLEEKMEKPVEGRHINLCDEVILRKKGKVQLTKDLYISVDSDIISFCCDINLSEEWSAVVVDNHFTSPFGSYHLKNSFAKDGIDLNKISGQLIATSRKDGDKIRLQKRKVTKSLKKAFNEMKIPAETRNEYAVLRDGENIVWVEGIGTDEKYLPDLNSKNVFSVIKDV